MKPSPLQYFRANSLQDALSALDRGGGNAKLLAGGQSLMPLLNLRLGSAETLIDISRIEDLNYVRANDGCLTIGAVTPHNSILHSELAAQHCPLLVEAYAHVAHHTIRNRGTLGGNICHSDPASEMPLVLSVLDATFVLAGSRGTREVQANGFFLGIMETAIRPDEILVEIRVPFQRQGEGCAFEEMSQRKGDFAIVATACRFTLDAGTCRNVRMGFAGAGVHIKRIPEVEAALEGASPSPEAFERALTIAVEHAQPDADIHADVDYKLDLIRSLGGRALKRAAQRAAIFTTGE